MSIFRLYTTPTHLCKLSVKKTVGKIEPMSLFSDSTLRHFCLLTLQRAFYAVYPNTKASELFRDSGYICFYIWPLVFCLKISGVILDAKSWHGEFRLYLLLFILRSDVSYWVGNRDIHLISGVFGSIFLRPTIGLFAVYFKVRRVILVAKTWHPSNKWCLRLCRCFYIRLLVFCSLFKVRHVFLGDILDRLRFFNYCFYV